MGSGSWRRRAEPMEADSIVSPLISPSYLGTVVFGLVGGGACVVCCLLHYIIQVFCNYCIILLPCLELDRLPRKKIDEDGSTMW